MSRICSVLDILLVVVGAAGVFGGLWAVDPRAAFVGAGCMLFYMGIR